VTGTAGTAGDPDGSGGPALDLDRYLAELRCHGQRLVSSARSSSLAAAVPSCPGWSVEQLARHTTKVHHWVSAVLAGADPAGFEFEQPAESELLEVLESGLADLATALRAAPAELPVWTFVPSGSATLYWARRLAHETAIHSVDAQLARGYGVADFEPDFAADGIDELVTELAPLRVANPGLAPRRTISLTPLDTNRSWTVSIGPDGVTGRRGYAEAGDLSVIGLACQLYRWVWNRAGDDEVGLHGDVTLADHWRHNLTVGHNGPPAPGHSVDR
jgi:uncharacterized protein (TIGR03083 family)